MKSNYLFMMLCLLASGFIGCSDDDGDNWKKTFEDEQARIKDFVYSKDSDPKIFTYHYTYLKENIEDYAYLFNYQKEGKKATYGDFVWINYTQRSLKGDIIDSSEQSIAVGAGVVSPYYTLGGPILVQMNTDAEKYIDPLSDILMNIPEGTTGSSIISSIMSLSTALVYREYMVEKIVTEHNLLAYEKSLMKQYLDTVSGIKSISEFTSNDEIVNNDTIAKIATFKVGTGAEITATDSVTIWMEGSILDPFGTSRKFLKMDKDVESVKESVASLKPLGLRLAMTKLKVGDKVQVLLPSDMGYGYGGGFDMSTGNCIDRKSVV